MSLSIVILTKNEEQMLPGLLNSIDWCDDTHLVDSGSSDCTVSLAEARGVRTYFHSFKGFGQQRNWALDHCEVKYEWVLFLDADERSTNEFRDAVLSEIQTEEKDIAAFYVCWKLMFEDRWLKRTGYFPNWQMRLVHRERARFIDHGHGQKEGEIDGRIEYIREPFLHFAFSKGWSAWLERHNRYSTVEAQLRLEQKANVRDILLGKSSLRIASLKILLTRVPAWPLIRFFHVYILRFGFLDGFAGLVQSINVSWYEYMIKLKMRELKIKKSDEKNS